MPSTKTVDLDPDLQADLAAMLEHHCSYPEDVAALAHFVFHPRLNNCSNICLVCLQGADPDSLEGHAESCAYAKAVRRTASSAGELQTFIDNY